MDGLSGAASVIAVIDLAAKLASTLKDYYKSVRDARSEIQLLYQAIKSLEVITSNIRTLLNRHNESLIFAKLLEDKEGPLELILGELRKLEEKIGVVPTTRTAKYLRSLQWPFQKPDVEKIVESIEKQKSTLGLQFGVENLNTAFTAFDVLQDMRKEIRFAQDRQDRRLIVDWLSKGVPDPSKDHNLARENHEPTTGDWLLNSLELESWITSSNSLLWLNGGAGTGKTILCSTVIGHMQNICAPEPGSVVAYWYFTFTETEKRTVSNALFSIITDILSNRQDTPSIFHAAYDQANHGQQRPTMAKLFEIFRAVLEGFKDVYLIFDAVDECPKSNGERQKFLEVLSDIVSCGAEVEDDIDTYLERRLQGNKFSRWTFDLKQQVRQELRSQADGMFRLVALQLDALARCRNETTVRKTIKSLPRTLENFYERIVSEIEDDDYEYALAALKWLAFSTRILSLEELAEAVIVRPSQNPCIDVAERFMDAKFLEDMLPAGLITTFDGYPYFEVSSGMFHPAPEHGLNTNGSRGSKDGTSREAVKLSDSSLGGLPDALAHPDSGRPPVTVELSDIGFVPRLSDTQYAVSVHKNEDEDDTQLGIEGEKEALHSEAASSGSSDKHNIIKKRSTSGMGAEVDMTDVIYPYS